MSKHPFYCELCDRHLHARHKTRHHLIPQGVSEGGGPTCVICKACHTYIHRKFTNPLLASQLHTVELLRDATEELRSWKCRARK